MKIPDSVIIGGLTYPVTIEAPSKLGKETGGEITYEAQTITLTDYGTETAKVIFLHECLHGMVNALGLIEHDEPLLRGLGFQLYQFIKDNPGIFAP